MHIAYLWIPLACAGCSLSTTTYQGDDSSDAGTTAPAPNDPHGGTRLQLERFVFGAASKISGIRDVMLNLDCSPARWSDGKVRCTPPAQTYVEFGDAACTQVIGVSGGGGPCDSSLPSFIVDTDSANNDTHLYTRGAALPQTTWYSNQSGLCQPQTVTGYQLYALGAEIAPDTLAEVTIDQTPIGAFSVPLIHSADGLQWQEPGFMHDDTYNVDCYLYPNGASIVCNPYPVAEASVFTDAQCTSPEGVVTYHTTSPITLVRDGFDSCTGSSYSLVGAPASPSSLWALDATNANTCVTTTSNPSWAYYTIGAPAPLATFTSVSTMTTDRIHSTQLASGPLHVDDTLYDSKLGVACSPFVSGDGTVHCLPSANFTSEFIDSNCQQAIDLVSVFHNSTCRPPVVPTYAVGLGACAIDGRKVGGRYTGPLYFNAGGMCQPFPMRDFDYYLATTQVPEDTFATGTSTTGP